MTCPPPHRSRRAVFSHRALQPYSLPQVGLCRTGSLSRLGSSNDPWSGNFQALQYCGVAWPGVTVPLATPIEPLQHNPYGCVEELWQAGGVSMDSVVVGIPTEFSVEPLAQYGQPEVAILLTPRGEALERGAAFLPCGPAFEVLLPLAILSPPQLDPQKLEPGLPCEAVPPACHEPWLSP